MVTTDATGTASFKRAFGLVEAMLVIDNPSGIDFYGDVGAHFTAEGLLRTDLSSWSSPPVQASLHN